MKWLLVLALFATHASVAQDAARFARALEQDSPRSLDRWMKRELHRQRKGTLVTSPSTTYTVHAPTYDSLVVWLRSQPGVIDAAWDRCVNKLLIWPGHSTIGVRIRFGGVVYERCYTLQEGRPGTIYILGWRPRVRKAREELKLVEVLECQGFVAGQRKNCDEP